MSSLRSVTAPTPRAPSPGSAWILSPFWDSTLFIGAPLICIAAFLPLRSAWGSENLSLFLLAFFTFGHHLPGFMRAYGDRELFARYRWRFLLAPPLILAATLWFSARDLHGLLFLVFTWDIWHVLMQHYGFMRIYDAKQGEISPWTARLDLAVSLSWYLTFIALSPQYRHNFFLRAYASGIPFLSPVLVDSTVKLLLGFSCLLTGAYGAYTFFVWKKRRHFNRRKLFTLAIFLMATGYLYIGLNDFTAGFAIWSAFHCLQYYGIVWAFNRNRVLKNQAVSLFVRFLFRPSPILVILYVGLILLYGGINYGIPYVSDERLRQWLMAFVITSGSLHYYYDGFIWKVRERETRRFLNITSPAESAEKSPVGAGGLPGGVPDWASLASSSARFFGRHLQRFRPAWTSGMTQAAYLSAAVLVLGALESWRPHSELAMRQSLVLASPQAGEGYFNLAEAYRQQGQLTEAATAFEEAAHKMPAYALARSKRGLTLSAMGQHAEAISEFEKAVALDPKLREAHYNLGMLLSRQGQQGRALAHLQMAFPQGDERALRLLDGDPAAAEILNNLALGVAGSGELTEARSLLERAVSVNPKHSPAQLNLANLYLLEGNLANARTQYERVLSLDPANPMAHSNLGLCLIQLGRNEDAVPHLQIGLRHGDEAVRASAQKALSKLAATQ
ncbi:MAG: tetratricopeptide repeat protein [Acidobacteria bacterium]|nr:tetratricopeptide repeat protein [Acidobacteriota bacterium]